MFVLKYHDTLATGNFTYVVWVCQMSHDIIAFLYKPVQPSSHNIKRMPDMPCLQPHNTTALA